MRLGTGVAVHYLQRVDSTNTWLKELCAAHGISQPALVFTDHQLAGRGTRGRTWMQQAGRDLALSIALPLTAGVSLDMRLSLAVGAAVAVALENACGIPLRVKWPNDILARAPGAAGDAPWLKAGGILLESCANEPSPDNRALVAGAGVNINSTATGFPVELAARLTTLSDVSGKPVNRTGVHLAVANALLGLLHDALQPGPGAISAIESKLADWFARDETAGTHYVLERDGVRLPVEARRVDAGTCGLVCVDAAGQEHLVTSYTELRTPGDGG